MTIWKPAIKTRPAVMYRAIAEALASDIAAGILKPGTRLPTQRKLAEALSVTVGTVGRAYALAEKTGLISLQVGRGSFVRDPHTPGNDSDGKALIDLGMSLPAPFPDNDLFAATLSHLARRPDLNRLFWHLPVQSTARHLGNAAAWMSRRMACSPDEVLVCGGTQSGLLMSLSALTKPGDHVLVESLTFPGLLSAARLLHLNLVPLELDEEGLVPESLAANARRAKVVYCIPTHHNPTGVTMPLARREQVAAVVRQNRLTVIEDDVYGLLVHDAPPPLVSLIPERGFLLCSLSKTLSLGLRLACLRFPAGFRDVLLERLRAIDCFLSPLIVEMASLWMEDGTAESLLKARRHLTRHRAAIASGIFEGCSFHCGPRANHLWLNLPATWQAAALQSAARENGVLINPASNFAVAPEPAPNAVRIALGAAVTDSELIEGLQRIRRLIASPAEQGATQYQSGY